MKPNLKPSEKYCITIKEATEYFSIGENTMRKIIKEPDCNAVLKVKGKLLLKRKQMEEYLDKKDIIYTDYV
jgi:hypothetical protein